jgi:HEAT repeat protein
MSTDRELAKWAAGLEAEEEPKRAQAAKELLAALARPGFKNSKAALSLLQASWWPLTPELIPQAVEAVLFAVRGMERDAPELEDASLLLGNLGREDASQLEALAAALRDPAPTVRRAAAGAVGRIGQAALATLPLLMECLSAPEEEVGGAALESLGTLGPLAPEAVAPALLTEAGRSSGARRYLALAGLRGLLEEPYRSGQPMAGLSDLEAVALLALDDEQPATRLEAAALLGMAPSGSAKGQGALQRCLSDPSPDVAAYSAVALLRRGVEGPEAPTRLRELLFSTTQEHRFAALSVLEGLEPSTAKRLKTVLEEAARQGPEDVRAVCRELVASLDVLQFRRGVLN